MARAPKKPASTADLPVLTEVPENEADLPVLTETPDAEPDLPVLTEVLAEEARPDETAAAAQAAERKPGGKGKSAASGQTPPANKAASKPAPAEKSAPANTTPAEQQPAAAPQAPETPPPATPRTHALQLTDAQLRQIADYVAPEVEKLLRKKIAARLDALWPKIWAEAEAELPEMIRTLIVESAKRTRK
ncbi:MAG TPA: hypothetical protein VKC56_11700 [Gallionellaceae bacterium]|nr:hypothetical protein [Gallionellaceae bacterium]